MAWLYTTERFLDHDTGQHPERAERLRQVVAQLKRTGLADRCSAATWEPATLEQLSRGHQRDYIESVATLAARGGGRIEADTVVSPASNDVARLAAGAVCDAVRRVVAGPDRRALCLIRPPGHHALPDGAMGFCLFNNVALGAYAALAEHRLDRVLIVDWDVHHGNGTQDTFWDDGRVGFLSVHRSPFYPGTGRADETGAGRGMGMIRNVPLPFGTPRETFVDRFTSALEDLAARIKPQLVIVSAGFDAHRDDPIGSLGLEVEDFGLLTERVLDVADEVAEGRVVSVLEGGYNPGILAGSVALHLERLLEREGKEPPPDSSSAEKLQQLNVKDPPPPR